MISRINPNSAPLFGIGAKRKARKAAEEVERQQRLARELFLDSLQQAFPHILVQNLGLVVDARPLREAIDTAVSVGEMESFNCNIPKGSKAANELSAYEKAVNAAVKQAKKNGYKVERIASHFPPYQRNPLALVADYRRLGFGDPIGVAREVTQATGGWVTSPHELRFHSGSIY